MTFTEYIDSNIREENKDILLVDGLISTGEYLIYKMWDRAIKAGQDEYRRSI